MEGFRSAPKGRLAFVRHLKQILGDLRKCFYGPLLFAEPLVKFSEIIAAKLLRHKCYFSNLPGYSNNPLFYPGVWLFARRVKFRASSRLSSGLSFALGFFISLAAKGVRPRIV